jgi:S1-C subfamily serine protease
MKRFPALLALFALLTVAVAVPAFAGSKCEAPDAQACLNQMSTMKDKGWSGVQVDNSDMTAIRVKAVTPGSPAAKAGIQVGDVLVALNGANFTDMEALKKAKGDWAVGQSVTYSLKRKGADKQIALKLDKMPENVFAQMIGEHMLEAHLNMAAATPTEPAPATAAPATAPATTTTKTDK